MLLGGHFYIAANTQTGLGLIGALSATPNEVPVGDTVLLNLQVQNTGSEVWSNLPLNIRLFKNDDVDAIATLSTTASQLAQVQTYQQSLSWKTLGQNGDRITGISAVDLNGQSHTIFEAPGEYGINRLIDAAQRKEQNGHFEMTWVSKTEPSL